MFGNIMYAQIRRKELQLDILLILSSSRTAFNSLTPIIYVYVQPIHADLGALCGKERIFI